MGLTSVILRGTSIRAWLLIALATAATSGFILVFIGNLETSLYLIDYTIGLKSNNAIVLTSKSITPQTSVVSIDEVTSLISSLNGVSKVEFYTMVPVEVNSKIITLRGLNAGSNVYGIANTSLDCVLASPKVISYLGVNNTDMDYVKIGSPLTGRVVLLRLCENDALDYPFSEELIASPLIARYLRGIDDRYASVAVIYFDSSRAKEHAIETLGINPHEKSLLNRVYVALERSGNGYALKFYQSYSDKIMLAININNGIVITVIIGISLIISSGMSIIGVLISRGEKNLINALAAVGVGLNSIRTRTSLIVLIISMPSSIIGGIIGRSVVGKLVNLRWMGYSMPFFHLDIIDYLVTAIPSVAIVIGVFLGEWSEDSQ